jgi:cytidylate kinase
MTSKLSSLPPVRAILLELQQNFAASPPQPARGAVLDGRDIGTVVCPNAHLKLFVTASPEIRAQRRTKELQQKGISTNYEAVLHDMVERDVRDKTRNIAPTVPAEDAIILDTSLMNADEVLKHALDLAANVGIKSV